MISGPYRGGTNDDPQLIRENLARLEAAAYEVFRLGHVPIVGEWFALPLMRVAGSKKIGDAIYNEISYPIAHRVLSHCQGLLRIPGASNGADEDVRLAKVKGIEVYHTLEEIPPATWQKSATSPQPYYQTTGTP